MRRAVIVCGRVLVALGWALLVMVFGGSASWASESPSGSPSPSSSVSPSSEPSPDPSPEPSPSSSESPPPTTDDAGSDPTTEPTGEQTADPEPVTTMETTATDCGTVEAPCVMVLSEQQPAAWEELRVTVLIGLSVVVFVQLATLVQGWGRRDG